MDDMQVFLLSISLGRGVTKPKLKNSKKKKTFALFYSVLNKEYLGKKIGFMNHGLQREVSCFPISLAFSLPHLNV
mgnify:CR=1 FL=1